MCVYTSFLVDLASFFHTIGHYYGRTRIQDAGVMSYFRWSWPTFPPMEGECGLPRSLQGRVNVVNLYFTSDGSGPHSLQWRVNVVSIQRRVNVVN